MITVEYGSPSIDRCRCCGQQMVWLTRLVYENENIKALYCANFTRNHDDKVVFGVVSFDQESSHFTSHKKIAFSFKIWKRQGNYRVDLIDRSASPWKSVPSVGDIVDVKEADRHPLLKDVMLITRLMVKNDPAIIEYFFS